MIYVGDYVLKLAPPAGRTRCCDLLKIIEMIGKLPYQNHALPIDISKVLAPKLKPDGGHHSPGTVLLPFADRSTCGQAQSPLTMPEFVILE
jgi:hypothetical protein